MAISLPSAASWRANHTMKMAEKRGQDYPITRSAATYLVEMGLIDESRREEILEGVLSQTRIDQSNQRNP